MIDDVTCMLWHSIRGAQAYGNGLAWHISLYILFPALIVLNRLSNRRSSVHGLAETHNRSHANENHNYQFELYPCDNGLVKFGMIPRLHYLSFEGNTRMV